MEFEVKTDRQTQLVDVTNQVNEAVKKSAVKAGLCNLFVPHTTAAIIVSENWDPDLTPDILRHLTKLVPRQAGFLHSEGNAQSHILSVMLSTSINIPVADGHLRLGHWQGVMLAEFDGPRRRSLVVTLVPAAE